MKATLLGDVCEVNPGTDADLQATQTCSFIPMEYVDERFGTISRQDTRTVGEVMNGHTFFKNGDVLFAKITPCMENGKAAIARGLINGIGFGSTEFHVVRPSKAVVPELVFYFLRQEKVRKYAQRRMTGSAGQQRVPSTVVEEFELPLPKSTREQKRIVAILGRSDRLRSTRQYARQVSDSFLQSVFLERFRSCFEAHHPKTPLGDLVTITGGGTPAREAVAYFKGSIPWFTSKDMQGDYIWDTQEHITDEAVAKSATKVVPVDSVLIVVKSKVLMHRLPLAISKVPLSHGQDIKSIQCGDRVLPEFARFVLKYYAPHLLSIARGANTEGLTLPMLEELLVPDVDLKLQQEFCCLVERFELLRAQQREAEHKAEHLFQTLLHRAFTGQLLRLAKSRSLTRKPSIPAQKRIYSPGLFYRRAVIEAYVVNALRGDQYLGRTKLEKIDHLIEYHCGIDLERYAVRDAAGPDDYLSRMKLEHLADKRNWFSAHDKKDGSIVRYLPKRGFMSAAQQGAQEIGAKLRAVDSLLLLMRPLDTKRCEIIATLYAAWNDFLLVGKNPSDDEIVHDVLNNWRPEKQLIPERRWLRGLKWMRDNGLVPRGGGKPVLKATKV